VHQDWRVETFTLTGGGKARYSKKVEKKRANQKMPEGGGRTPSTDYGEHGNNKFVGRGKGNWKGRNPFQYGRPLGMAGYKSVRRKREDFPTGGKKKQSQVAGGNGIVQPGWGP